MYVWINVCSDLKDVSLFFLGVDNLVITDLVIEKQCWEYTEEHILSELSVADDQDSKTDSVVSPAKKQEPVLLHQEIKQENVSGKKKVSAKKQKVDNGKNSVCDIAQINLIVKPFCQPWFSFSSFGKGTHRIITLDLKKQEFHEGKIAEPEILINFMKSGTTEHRIMDVVNLSELSWIQTSTLEWGVMCRLRV